MPKEKPTKCPKCGHHDLMLVAGEIPHGYKVVCMNFICQHSWAFLPDKDCLPTGLQAGQAGYPDKKEKAGGDGS